MCMHVCMCALCDHLNACVMCAWVCVRVYVYELPKQTRIKQWHDKRKLCGQVVCGQVVCE